MESLRDRSFYLTVGLFAILGVGLGVLYVRASQGAVTGINLLVLVALSVTFLVPLAALTNGYEAVAGPRRSGALKVVLGLPYTRRDVVVGAYLGRLGMVLSAVAALLVTAHVVALLGGMPVAPAEAVVLFGAAVLLSMAFVGVAVGISVVVRSSTWGAALAFGFFLLSVLLWSQALVRALVFLANGLSTPATRPEWANVVDVCNPLTAYRSVVAELVPELSGAVFGGAPGPRDAFYRSPVFGAAVLLAWAVLAPLAGLVRFDRSDL